MGDDSMCEVAEAVRSAASQIRVQPTAALVAGVRDRAAKLRRTRRAMIAIGAVVCLVALAVAVAVAVVPGRRAERVVTAALPSTSGTVTPTSGPTSGAAPGSRTVTYMGVQVVVSARWPLLVGSKAPVCGGGWPTVPTVYVGPQDDSSGCGGVGPTTTSHLDGVALEPSDGPVSGTVAVTLRSGQHVQEIPPVSEGPGSALLFHGVWVRIGPDTPTAAATSVLASLAYQPTAPSTAVVDVCTTIPASEVMPTPQRLDHRLVLQHGNYVLDPPPPGEAPAVSAAVVWAAAKPSPGSQTVDSQQLLLTLFSAPFPATLQPGGRTVPDDQNLLVWVVYSTPLNPSVPDCGGWGINVFNATTGAQLISGGWTPGP